ncbi:MAG: Ldh family oxidoreductase [Anaerolineae bacterium]
MIHIAAMHLRSLVQQVFEAAGVAAVDASQVALSLVENNLTGHDSHGVLRVGSYIDGILDGTIRPGAELSVVRESATTALLDGGRQFGQITARAAMEMAIAKARAHDLGMVAIRNCAHTGRLGEYAVQATEQGCMGLVFSSGCARHGVVAPFLGTERALNTNPIAWAVPAGNHPPVFLDYATSVCAQGKIQAAVDKGVRVPEGWLLDAQGDPTTDPTEQARGGVLLPFGAHKGYALGFLIELLAGGLAGASCALLPEYVSDYPTILMAVHIEALQPLDEFRRMVDQQIEAIKATRKAPGVEEILVPGESEWSTRAARLRDGLQLPDATWQRIVQAGARVGLTLTLAETNPHS